MSTSRPSAEETLGGGGNVYEGGEDLFLGPLEPGHGPGPVGAAEDQGLLLHPCPATYSRGEFPRSNPGIFFPSRSPQRRENVAVEGGEEGGGALHRIRGNRPQGPRGKGGGEDRGRAQDVHHRHRGVTGGGRRAASDRERKEAGAGRGLPGSRSFRDRLRELLPRHAIEKPGVHVSALEIRMGEHLEVEGNGGVDSGDLEFLQGAPHAGQAAIPDPRPR